MNPILYKIQIINYTLIFIQSLIDFTEPILLNNNQVEKKESAKFHFMKCLLTDQYLLKVNNQNHWNPKKKTHHHHQQNHGV